MNDTTMDIESDRETKKPLKEIPIIQDQGSFRHDTGDTYEGNFEAKKKDRSIKMNGPGKYVTAEGDTYTGYWESDKLGAKGDDVTITFADGSKYEGPFKDWSYHSSGMYSYSDGSELKCDFSENCPVGPLTFTDPNGHTWLGRAEQGYGWLEPVNHYYEILEKTVKYSHKAKRQSTKRSVDPDKNAAHPSSTTELSDGSPTSKLKDKKVRNK